MDKLNTDLKKIIGKKSSNNLILPIIAAAMILIGGIACIIEAFVFPNVFTIANIIFGVVFFVICSLLYTLGAEIPAFLGVFIFVIVIAPIIIFFAAFTQVIFSFVIRVITFVLVISAFIISIIAFVKACKKADGREKNKAKVISIIDICLGVLLILFMIITLH